MALMKGKIYQFEDYLLDVSEQRLQKNGQDISLPPKVFGVLSVLVDRPGHLVGSDELMKAVWQDTFVEETNLRYCVHSLRKILDKDFIETVPKRGYRFNAPVKSFTTEEFIQKYAGENLSATPPKSDSPVSDKTKSAAFYSKPALLIGVALLMALVGVSAYYLWQKNNQPPEKRYLKSIAVLPFTIIGEKAERQDDIQKGLADALVFNLGRIRDLKVTPTKEVQNYFGQDFEPLEAGKSLRTEEVLTGTYRLENNLGRVNVSLLRVRDGETLWTKSFTIKEENPIELENSIALPIARQAELNVARLRDESRIKDLNISEEIKKSYLIAREIVLINDFNRRQEATELFEKVLAAEPDWALANAGYAEALVLTHGEEEGCKKAPTFAQKALELDSSMAEAHLVFGRCHHYNWDWKNAEEAYQKAISLKPDYAWAYHEYAVMLDLQRRFAEAETNFKKALELEPFSPHFRSSFCQHFYYDKNFNEALAQCAQVQQIDAEFWRISKLLYWIYVAQGRYEEVLKLNFGHLTEAEKAKNPMARALSEGNVPKYWKASLETRLANPKRRFSPFAVASMYAYLGNKEKTLDYLEKAAEEPFYYVPVAHADPMFDLVRREPRFIQLMKKIDLQP
jgi:DNA-binding winged helix-turn-helix (wHTH) protein/TolB-like protein/Flp pilus assembly protein TadD